MSNAKVKEKWACWTLLLLFLFGLAAGFSLVCTADILVKFVLYSKNVRGGEKNRIDNIAHTPRDTATHWQKCANIQTISIKICLKNTLNKYTTNTHRQQRVGS